MEEDNTANTAHCSRIATVKSITKTNFSHLWSGSEQCWQKIHAVTAVINCQSKRKIIAFPACKR